MRTMTAGEIVAEAKAAEGELVLFMGDKATIKLAGRLLRKFFPDVVEFEIVAEGIVVKYSREGS